MIYLKRVHHTAKDEHKEELTEEEQKIVDQWYEKHNEKQPIILNF